MAGHTPGPWEIDVYGDVIANGEDVARIVACDDSHMPNARLIAAAPELLEALQEMVDEYGLTEATSCSQSVLKLARLAIAKAEGK